MEGRQTKLSKKVLLLAWGIFPGFVAASFAKQNQGNERFHLAGNGSQCHFHYRTPIHKTFRTAHSRWILRVADPRHDRASHACLLQVMSMRDGGASVQNLIYVIRERAEIQKLWVSFHSGAFARKFHRYRNWTSTSRTYAKLP